MKLDAGPTRTTSLTHDWARARAVLLDVDGTLIDSNEAHAAAWSSALREHGFSIDTHQVRALIGMGGDKLLPAIAQIAHDSDVGRAVTLRKKYFFGTLLTTLRPTRGARDFLIFLRDVGLDVVVATSADDEEVHALLAQAGVADLIPERASKDDARESKPSPDIIHAALAKAEAQPDETILVGDTPYDIQAGTQAGVATIVLRCGGHWSDSALAGAVALFDDPAALLAHWRGAPSSRPFCLAISTIAELDAVLAESFYRPVFLLKHSDSCGRSEFAMHTTLRELDRWTEEVGCRLVVVQESRGVSDAIQRRLGIRHETPQLLLLRHGRVVWHASHWKITDAAMRRAVEEVIETRRD